MYKAVFIDWDDTLGDWSHAAYHAQQDIYEAFRLSEFFQDFDSWYQAYHEHNLDLWQRYGHGDITKEFLQRDRFLWPIVQQLGGGELLYHSSAMIALADRIGPEFLSLTNRYFTLLPGAEDLVRYLSARYPLTVISNGFGEVQYYKFHYSGLESLFSHLIISEEVGVNKPQPRIFDIALERNNERLAQAGLPPLRREDCIMIGDSYSSDIAGAKAAGIDQLWLTADPGTETATYIVRSLQDIYQIL